MSPSVICTVFCMNLLEVHLLWERKMWTFFQPANSFWILILSSHPLAAFHHCVYKTHTASIYIHDNTIEPHWIRNRRFQNPTRHFERELLVVTLQVPVSSSFCTHPRAPSCDFYSKGNLERRTSLMQLCDSAPTTVKSIWKEWKMSRSTQTVSVLCSISYSNHCPISY